MNIGDYFRPEDGAAIRFTTTRSLGTDLAQHGINGFFRCGRYYSTDMADYWLPHEITNWEPTASGNAAAPDGVGGSNDQGENHGA